MNNKINLCELTETKLKIAQSYQSKLMESEKFKDKEITMTFDNDRIYFLCDPKECGDGNKEVDYQCRSVTWEQAEEEVFKYTSKFSKTKFFFEKRDDSDTKLNLVTKDNVYRFSIKSLANIVAIDKFGLGARACLDEFDSGVYYATNVAVMGKLRVSTIEESDLVKAANALVQGVPVALSDVDQQIVVECRMNTSINYLIANYLHDHRLARTNCSMYKASDDCTVLKFNVETQQKEEIIEHLITSDESYRFTYALGKTFNETLTLKECVDKHNLEINA
tara:strand:- start:243955 stop:244788 length:834 start_codon:yes stop_codon:yes gene_type:complete